MIYWRQKYERYFRFCSFGSICFYGCYVYYRQQIKKHTDKLEKLEEIEKNKNQDKEKENA